MRENRKEGFLGDGEDLKEKLRAMSPTESWRVRVLKMYYRLAREYILSGNYEFIRSDVKLDIMEYIANSLLSEKGLDSKVHFNQKEKEKERVKKKKEKKVGKTLS